MGSIEKAKNLEDIRRICRPKPLQGEELDTFFVESDTGRDPDQNFRQHVINGLYSKEAVRLLFFGQQGCGMTTELGMLLRDIKERFLTVFFSVYDHMNPMAICAEDLMVIIAEEVLIRAGEAGLKLDEEELRPALEFFRAAKTDYGLKRVPQRLSDELIQLRKEIKLDSYSKETRIAGLRKHPGDILAYTNRIIKVVQKALPPGKQLLIIAGDLNKLGILQARKMFMNNVNLLSGIEGKIIYTAPLFLLHSSDLHPLRKHFDEMITLPMIQVTEPPGEPVQGFDVVKKIILQRLSFSLIEPYALYLLVKNTGGVLRHAFEVLHTASLMSSVRIPLEQYHIRYGLTQLRKEFWQQITLPYDSLPDGPKSVEDLYERLTVYARRQMKGMKTPPVSDSINQLLLASCALIEYSSYGWFGVHPLVIINLKEMGRLS